MGNARWLGRLHAALCKLVCGVNSRRGSSGRATPGCLLRSISSGGMGSSRTGMPHEPHFWALFSILLRGPQPISVLST